MNEPIFPPDDPYAELGLDPSFSDAEIRRAYFAQVRGAGPEKDPGRFKRIRAAYERLSTPERRFETDLLRLQAWMPAPLEAGPPGAGLGAEVLAAARSLSDLERVSFHEDFREVIP